MATLVPSSDPGSNDPIGALPTTPPPPAPPPASAPAPEVASAPIATTLTPPPPAPILGGNSSAGLVEKKPSLWSSILMGALWGLAGSAGQKHFGGGVAAGAAGAFEGQAQQQQLKFESLRAADSHVRALNEARAADTADEVTKRAMAERDAAVSAMNKALGIPDASVKISGTTSDELHAQANGALTSLAAQNGGKIPPVTITQNPPTGDKQTHDISVYAPPNAAQTQQNPDAFRALTNADRAIQGLPPRTEQDWKTGDGTIIPDPTHPVQTIAAQHKWQAAQIADAQEHIYGVPKASGNVAKDQGVLAGLKQQLAQYNASSTANPAVSKALESRQKQFEATVQAELQQNSTKGIVTLDQILNDPAQMAGNKAPAAKAMALGILADPTRSDLDRSKAQRVVSQADFVMKTEQDQKLQLAAENAAAMQSAKMGDPKAAGRLMAAGVLNPQIIRSYSIPAFMTAAIAEARKIDPNFSEAALEGRYKAAEASSNVVFFGSANSLLDPGGTLGLLADKGKEIPQSKVPKLNTIEDWEKLATGNGPLAGYASYALGVADDYGKVMGGGTASDTARNQALKLLDPSLSPAQRKESIDGIRNSVTSQVRGRIGTNPIMRQMYGQNLPAQDIAPKVGDVKVFPNGAKGVWDGKGYARQ